PAPFKASWSGTFATTSYAGNGLVFKGNTGGIPRTFVDGTSNTIMFAERYQVCAGATATGGTVQNLWGLGVYNQRMPLFAVLAPSNQQSTNQVAPSTALPKTWNNALVTLRVGKDNGPTMTK